MTQMSSDTQNKHDQQHGDTDDAARSSSASDASKQDVEAPSRDQADQEALRDEVGAPNPNDAPIVQRVEEEREPRRHALRRGRFLLAIYLVGLVAAVALTLGARSFSVLPGDLPFTRELQETSNPVITSTMVFTSAIGYPVQSAILLIIAVLALWIIRLRVEALFVIVSLLADALAGLLKSLVGRHRPLPSIVHVMQPLSDGSFPSGHTLHYTVFYGFLIFVVGVNFRPSWPRALAIILLALPIALIGLSRVYLGEHWVTDVVGGYLIGALFLAPLIYAYIWTKQRFAIAARPPFLRRV